MLVRLPRSHIDPSWLSAVEWKSRNQPRESRTAPDHILSATGSLPLSRRVSSHSGSSFANRCIQGKPLIDNGFRGKSKIGPRKRAWSHVFLCASDPWICSALPTFGVRTRWLPNRLIGSIAMDFEQFMPRGWPFAARSIAGEVRCWQVRPRFFNRRNNAPLRLYFVSARK
jgi:hypothetical protein